MRETRAEATLLPLAEAAPLLRISPGTLRRWVREGCPASLGGPGAGKGYRVSCEAVRAWRDSKGDFSEAQLREIERLALDFYRRGMEPDVPGQRVLGISNARAAALLVFFLQYVSVKIFAAEITSPELELLAAIARQG